MSPRTLFILEDRNMTWIQLQVRKQDSIQSSQVDLMKRCDPVLQRFGAVPHAPDGVPIVDADGTIGVRVYATSMVGIVKNYLTDQGFVIVEEQEHE
jgi:hypothetical protein